MTTTTKTADPAALEEGQRCPIAGCDGTVVLVREGDCACHIAPPCPACTDAHLSCDVCGKERRP
ncbi:hypothetical protein AB7M45_007870 [Bradyrhizobium elkanii]|uniref:hypothetical protein n=1 Tax=Bradyrhizobium elkanii TaxID=29448 RepID=UPI000F735B26|nr:hypothetical protein [Bradyrhizobium elkanii]MCW2195099.1 hypothetical protein [Bradyrhizobium elkanii]NWL67209.1 hypothetical protein [Bradyrhizobium elkanii]